MKKLNLLDDWQRLPQADKILYYSHTYYWIVLIENGLPAGLEGFASLSLALKHIQSYNKKKPNGINFKADLIEREKILGVTVYELLKEYLPTPVLASSDSIYELDI